MALTIDKIPLPASPRRSSVRQLKIAFTVSHHSTVVGNGNGLANAALRAIWRTREASAHEGIDGGKVAQLVDHSLAAWATANYVGNHAGVNVEHANSTGGPRWELSALTLLTGAQRCAEIHVEHGLGRPRMNITMKRHSDFFATACPGPFFADSWANYCYQAQQHYDLITTGKSTTTDGIFGMTSPINYSNGVDRRLASRKTNLIRITKAGRVSIVSGAADCIATVGVHLQGIKPGDSVTLKMTTKDMSSGKYTDRRIVTLVGDSDGDAKGEVTFAGTVDKGDRLRVTMRPDTDSPVTLTYVNATGFTN